jgi:glutathione-regulated potassium-efflux system ancillary protein KefG
VPRSVLILFAHPAYHKSRAGRALIEAVQGLPDVRVHDLYEVYPDLLIDVKHEQKLILGHDALVFQHPFYWYSAPALLKEWIDVVLTHGFAYGKAGKALTGKLWLTAVTAGGRDEMYGASGMNRFPVEELLRPFEATAHLCGLVWQKPHIFFASHFAGDEELKAAGAQYAARIRALQDEPALRTV